MTALDPELQEAVNALFALLDTELAADRVLRTERDDVTLDKILAWDTNWSRAVDTRVARYQQQAKVLKMLWPYCTVVCPEIE